MISLIHVLYVVRMHHRIPVRSSQQFGRGQIALPTYSQLVFDSPCMMPANWPPRRLMRLSSQLPPWLATMRERSSTIPRRSGPMTMRTSILELQIADVRLTRLSSLALRAALRQSSRSARLQIEEAQFGLTGQSRRLGGRRERFPPAAWRRGSKAASEPSTFI